MAGSAMTFTYDEVGPIKRLFAAWTSDSATGAVTGTSKKIVGHLLKIVTDPDSTTAPDADYDIVVTDEESVNVLGVCEDDLVDRHTSTTEQLYCIVKNYAGTPVGIALHPVVCDKLTFAVSAAGNSKLGQIIVYWE